MSYSSSYLWLQCCSSLLRTTTAGNSSVSWVGGGGGGGGGECDYYVLFYSLEDQDTSQHPEGSVAYSETPMASTEQGLCLVCLGLHLAPTSAASSSSSSSSFSSGEVCICSHCQCRQLWIVSHMVVTWLQDVSHDSLAAFPPSALASVIIQPADFATFFLYIMIANFVLSLAYYGIMKVSHPPPSPLLTLLPPLPSSYSFPFFFPAPPPTPPPSHP